MIACLHRAASLALVSGSMLVTAPAWAGDPPADPPAAEGAPALAEAAEPPMRQVPYGTPPTASPLVRRVDASEPRKITGMVLTAIGIYHGFAGSVVLGSFAAIDGGSGFGFAYGLIIGGPLMADGLILTCIGLPLWVSGAKTVEKLDDPSASLPVPGTAWVPSVDVGAGTASATWHF